MPKKRFSSGLFDAAKRSRNGDLAELLPPRLAASIKYGSFTNSHHVDSLKLDSGFFASLTPASRVLEVGSWSGRLAERILKHSNMLPENYEMADLKYAGPRPFMRRWIHGLVKSGKIKLIPGNIFHKILPENYYEHILIPESFFPSELEPKRFEALRAEKGPKEAAIAMLVALALRLYPSLRQGGSLRISSVHFTIGKIHLNPELPRLLPQFQFATTKSGLILIKK